MTVHGLRPEFQPSNLASTQTSANTTQEPLKEVKASTGEHEGIPSLHAKPADLTGLGQGLDIQA